jgi:uncharacterized protein
LKKILLISDTHSYLEPALLKHIHEADEVWHAGDIGDPEVCAAIEALKPLRAVRGNIDSPSLMSRYPEDLCFACEGVKVLITHIAGAPGKYPARVKQLLTEHRPKLFVCGHSHILKVQYDKGNEMLYMNPGACGTHGFHHIKTALRFEIEGADIKNLVIIELGKRAKS